MKITFFIGHMGYGGAERVISLLANDYCRRGWDTDIVMLLSNDLAQKLSPGSDCWISAWAAAPT